MENNNTEEKEKKTGILYMTENDNMFIGEQNMSPADYTRFSLETDINAFKEKIAKLEADLLALSKGEHSEEIERDTHLTQKEELEEKPKASGFESIQPSEETSEQKILPSFAIMTRNGMKQYSDMKVTYFDKITGNYLLDNGTEKLQISSETFQTISHPEKLNLRQEKFTNIEIAEDRPAIVIGSTKIPEFAVLTAAGIQSYKNLALQNYNNTDGTYTLSNGNTTLSVTADTFREITRPERFENHFDEKTAEYEKLIQSQYDDYFKQRENTANNFRHNLSVYCRKEANTPLDALQIAKDLVGRMDNEEKRKTQQLLKQIAKEDETINQLIVRTYFEAVKEVPLNQETVLQKRNEKLITNPFYDTITTNGQLIDKDSNLKIGGIVKDLAFNTVKLFGHGKEKFYEDLTIISASKEGNNVILMDKNRSFYEVTRDSLLNGYNKQQDKQRKAEMKQHRANRIDVGWER